MRFGSLSFLVYLFMLVCYTRFSTSAPTASSATPPAVSVVPIDAVASQVIQRLLGAAAGASLIPNSGNPEQSESRMLFRLALCFSLSVSTTGEFSGKGW